MNDLTLKQLWQQVAEKTNLEIKYKELCAQHSSVETRLKQLEKTRRAEQADVDRLEGRSLAAFFYQVIGRMDEKLDQERQEAYAARVKYDAAARELASIDADLVRCRAVLSRLEGCERRYQEALAEKVRELKAARGPAAQELMECETRIEGIRLQKKELQEAIEAGETALQTAGEVLDSLDSAEGWSTWDVMGGGLGVDLAKYSSLDEAQEQVERLQVELRRFKTELADVEINADLRVAVDGFTRFADYFFDNLFTDWAVLDHIQQAQRQAADTHKQIKRVLSRLRWMNNELDAQLEDEREKREQIALNAE